MSIRYKEALSHTLTHQLKARQAPLPRQNWRCDTPAKYRSRDVIMAASEAQSAVVVRKEVSVVLCACVCVWSALRVCGGRRGCGGGPALR